jgi:hypothetical protein
MGIPSWWGSLGLRTAAKHLLAWYNQAGSPSLAATVWLLVEISRCVLFKGVSSNVTVGSSGRGGLIARRGGGAAYSHTARSGRHLADNILSEGELE